MGDSLREGRGDRQLVRVAVGNEEIGCEWRRVVGIWLEGRCMVEFAEIQWMMRLLWSVVEFAEIQWMMRLLWSVVGCRRADPCRKLSSLS